MMQSISKDIIIALRLEFSLYFLNVVQRVSSDKLKRYI